MFRQTQMGMFVPNPFILTSPRKLKTTAEPLDKTRLRFFQPTLGFLSAIGKNYGNCERGYPQVLNGLVLKGFIFENS